MTSVEDFCEYITTHGQVIHVQPDDVIVQETRAMGAQRQRGGV